MNTIQLDLPSKEMNGSIVLDGSKSVSNRLLIAKALCHEALNITGLSTSKDTTTLKQLLLQESKLYDAGAAGTTFRFLTAYLCTQPGIKILTGSARMLERPVGPLVDALNSLGAAISYEGKEGFPPLSIGTAQWKSPASIRIPANISSQFITALLLIGPVFPQGLTIELEGQIVSQTYIQLTLGLMEALGVSVQTSGNVLMVPPGVYKGSEIEVEADWSAASYYYSICALTPGALIRLKGLSPNSLQGDRILEVIYASLGVTSTWEGSDLVLTQDKAPAPFLEFDFLECPDIAQTVAVTCAGLGVMGLFSGLETLRIKETDRIAALQTELAKVGVSFTALPARFSKDASRSYFALEGKVVFNDFPPVFATYEDHRMAMAFAPLGCLGTVGIQEPEVVSKSYPHFWEALKSIGFSIQTLT